MDIIKNPVVLGVAGGAITYFYMNKKLEETNKKRIKKGKKEETLNLLIPFAIGIIICIIAYVYFAGSDNIINAPKNNISNLQVNPDMVNNVRNTHVPMPIDVVPQYRHIGDVKSSPIDFNGEFTGFDIVDHTKLNSLKSDFLDI